MNRIFNPYGEGWPKFPRRAYARLDQREPIFPDTSDEAVFALDAIDADWQGLAPGGVFDLFEPDRLRTLVRSHWKKMLGPTSARPDATPFDEIPIYRIEVTTRYGDKFYNQLLGLAEEEWTEVRLESTGDFEVDVYGGLFAAPVFANLASLKPVGKLSGSLSTIVDLDDFPDATQTEMEAALANLGALDNVVMFDVGQGSAIGLVDAAETVKAYFDLGCGVYGNKHTGPLPLRFCWRGQPPVILSHWDADHWSGEVRDPAAQPRTWLAPRQKIGVTHVAFINRVLSGGGNVLIWGNSPPSTTIPVGSNAVMTLARCSGSTRNGSGISCKVEDSNTGDGWLLTGDAAYNQLALTLPARVRVASAPHHGANMGSAGIPPKPFGYARLMYSFGPGNKHGRTKVTHPTAAAVGDHIAQGWDHGGWLPSAPGTMNAGPCDVLATASNPSTHEESAAGSWAAKPTVPFKSVPCAKSATASYGCTSKVHQA